MAGDVRSTYEREIQVLQPLEALVWFPPTSYIVLALGEHYHIPIQTQYHRQPVGILFTIVIEVLV